MSTHPTAPQPEHDESQGSGESQESGGDLKEIRGWASILRQIRNPLTFFALALLALLSLFTAVVWSKIAEPTFLLIAILAIFLFVVSVVAQVALQHQQIAEGKKPTVRLSGYFATFIFFLVMLVVVGASKGLRMYREYSIKSEFQERESWTNSIYIRDLVAVSNQMYQSLEGLQQSATTNQENRAKYDTEWSTLRSGYEQLQTSNRFHLEQSQSRWDSLRILTNLLAAREETVQRLTNTNSDIRKEKEEWVQKHTELQLRHEAAEAERRGLLGTITNLNSTITKLTSDNAILKEQKEIADAATMTKEMRGLKEKLAKAEEEKRRSREAIEEIVSRLGLNREVGLEASYGTVSESVETNPLLTEPNASLSVYGIQITLLTEEARSRFESLVLKRKAADRAPITVKILAFRANSTNDTAVLAQSMGTTAESLKSQIDEEINYLRSLHRRWTDMATNGPALCKLEIKTTGIAPLAGVLFLDQNIPTNCKMLLTPYFNGLTLESAAGLLFRNNTTPLFVSLQQSFQSLWQPSRMLDTAPTSASLNSIQ